MADVTLKYLLFGEDRSASRTVKKVAEDAESASSKVAGAVGRLGSTVGGELGDLLDRASQGIASLDGRGDKLGKRLLAVGSIATGAGIAMQQMASGDVEAQNRLDSAVASTGKTVEDFQGKVDALVDAQTRWGHTDGETKNALAKLVDAYHDPEQALQRMQLATDAAAAKNISLADAAGIVARAHGGSAKAFKEFGITVGQASDGTKDYEGALDQLATQLTGRADAASDSFGGRLRELKSTAENAASAFAEKYGPAITAAGVTVSALGTVLDIVKSRQAASAAAALVAAEAETTAAAATVGHSVAARALNLAIAATPIGIILAAVSAIGFYAQAQANAQQAATDFAATLDKQTGALTEASRAFVADKLLKDFAAADWEKIGAEAGIGINDFTDALVAGGPRLAEFRAQFDQVQESFRETGTSEQKQRWEALGNAFAAASRDMDNGAKKAEQTRRALGGVSTATQGALDTTLADAAAMKRAAEAADELAAAQGRLRDKVLDVRRADRDYEQSLADLKQSITDNGKTLDIHTEKGRENEAALDALRDSAIGAAEAALRQGRGVEEVAATMDARRQAFVDQATRLTGNKTAAEKLADQLGLTRGKVDELSTAILSTPDGKDIKITVDAATAIWQAQQLHDLLASIPGLAGAAKVQAQNAAAHGATGAAIATRAGGGPTERGAAYIIGEQGPELWVSPGDGHVIDASATAQILAGGGGMRPVGTSASSPSLVGVRMVGTLDTPWGPAQVDARIAEVLDAQYRAAMAGVN